MKAINPATEQVIGEYPEHDDATVDHLLAVAQATFEQWRHVSFAERANHMRAAGKALRDNLARYAGLITAEMGKPITQSETEVTKCAAVCDFYADQAEAFLSPQAIASDASDSFVRYDPLGAILAVMPWNFPLWQVFRFAAPALMAGNVGLLKHASNVPGCALAIEEVFHKAGMPTGAFTTLMISSRQVPRVIQNPIIKAATLTGSEPAGAAVAAEAGKALKKTVLELGGSDPCIVLDDADIQTAAAGATTGRTINTGQSCIAAKRFIVDESIADAFEAAFIDRMAGLKLGDPTQRDTNLGPMARPEFVDELQDQVDRAVQAGATLALGGKKPKGKGYYYPATVLTHVRPGMSVFDEETFGPVAAVIRAKDETHAVALANLSPYGLGASIWTGDPARGKAMAVGIEAGAVFVNGIVKSDPRLPFGGIKRSGYGRELADLGIREFVNIKTVWIK